VADDYRKVNHWMNRCYAFLGHRFTQCPFTSHSRCESVIHPTLLLGPPVQLVLKVGTPKPLSELEMTIIDEPTIVPTPTVNQVVFVFFASPDQLIQCLDRRSFNAPLQQKTHHRFIH
jgi:hypothetical protein